MLTITGVIMMILGPLLSWVGSLSLYGYGNLIADVSEIRRNVFGGNVSDDTENAETTEKRIVELQKLRIMDLISEEEFNNAIANIR